MRSLLHPAGTRTLLLLASVSLTFDALSAEPAFEGTVSATLSRGANNQHQLEFTRKGNLLRIEDTSSKVQPVNLIDLGSNKLIILYRHNSTFTVSDLARLHRPATSAAPPLPGNASVGPAGMPMPPPPPIPEISGPNRLQKNEAKKQILGHECSLYTIENRTARFEIWAIADSALFPFRLIELDVASRNFGPQMLEDQWIELARAESIFPLEATLRMSDAGDTEPLSFKIDKIDPHKIDNDAIFQPPENYQEVLTPQS